jgi:hypothetical protein
MLPPIPATWSEWGAAARVFLVEPILNVIREHTSEHEMLMAQLAPNGHEDMLVPSERNTPIRQLTILNRVGVRRLESEILRHRRFSERALRELNADRTARGLNPLADEDDEEGG